MSTCTYKIKKGWHYCCNFFPKIRILCEPKTLSARSYCFLSDMSYDIEEKAGVNKLFGWCYGFLGVHKQSERFGWVSSEGKITLYSYIYDNGKLQKEAIYETELPCALDLSLLTYYYKKDRQRLIAFIVNNQVVKTIKTNYPKSRFIIELGPYFGGNLPAPKDFEIPVVKRYGNL